MLDARHQEPYQQPYQNQEPDNHIKVMHLCFSFDAFLKN